MVSQDLANETGVSASLEERGYIVSGNLQAKLVSRVPSRSFVEALTCSVVMTSPFIPLLGECFHQGLAGSLAYGCAIH